jgi:glycerophosphoryl diester phosphodiesterase
LLLLFFLFPALSSQLIDHKGANNPFDWKSSGCAAQQIYEVRYPYPDNTIAAIRESFRQGADAVEIDLRLTGDADLVLFQEEQVDCLTDGKGEVRSFTLSQLKRLDFGYNIYKKPGEFVFRGQGVGRIVSLREVLREFPQKKFMLNPKDKDSETARVLVKILKEFKRDYSGFSFWGAPNVYGPLKKSIPSFGPFVANHHQSYQCWESWKSQGVFGVWPEICRQQKTLSLNLEEWSVDWWLFPFPFLHLARAQGLSVWLFNLSDPHLIRGLLIHSGGIIANDLSTKPLDGGAD